MPARAPGRAIRMIKGSSHEWKMGPCHARFVRTAALISENLVVFMDRVTADQPHTFDLATHYAGAWRNVRQASRSPRQPTNATSIHCAPFERQYADVRRRDCRPGR